MIEPNSSWTVAIVIAVSAVGGCKSHEPPTADHNAEQQELSGVHPPRRTAERTVAVEDQTPKFVEREAAQQLWPELANYRDWTAHTAAPVRGEHPQGEYIHLFYNDTAKAAIGGEGEWPDDTIFVKDNFAAYESGDGPGELAAITVMKKGAGVWFWAQYGPDGSVVEAPDGSVVAGTVNVGCIDCHLSSQQRDHVITELGSS